MSLTANLLYAILIAFSAFAIGGAVVGAYATTRLIMMGGHRLAKLLWHATILQVGIILTQGTLAFTLISTGRADPSGRAWFYAVGLAAQSVGLLGAARVAADTLAREEAVRRRPAE